MKIQWLLRFYGAMLLICVAVSYAGAGGIILLLLLVEPHVVLYLLDVLAPVTNAIKGFLWAFFPEVQWLRKAGEFMGKVARGALSFSNARSQAIGRLTLLDGPVLLTTLAYSCGLFLRSWARSRVKRWFNVRFEIVPKRQALAQSSEPATQSPVQQESHGLPPAPQLKTPHDSS
jgi:hypothetical protein